jgi:EpsI family protein
MAVAFVAIWAALAMYRPVAAPLARPLATLPLVLGDWRATGSDVRTAPWWRDADDALRRTYVGPDGVRVEVALGYFAVQTQGREAASHLSAPLHRAMVGVERLAVPGGDAGRVGRIRLAVAGGQREGVFWYDVGGRIVTSQTAAKLAAGRSALTTRRAPGLLVVVLEADRSPDGPAAGRPAMLVAAELVRALQPVLGG